MLGKKGIAWYGARIMWYDVESNQYYYYHTNQISENDIEDGKLSTQCLATLLAHHRASYGSMHDQFILSTDGAGAFAGIDFMARLPYLYQEIGWRIISHYTGESGGGKGEVDANFALGKKLVRYYVTAQQGERDIGTVRDLVEVFFYHDDTIIVLVPSTSIL